MILVTILVDNSFGEAGETVEVEPRDAQNDALARLALLEARGKVSMEIVGVDAVKREEEEADMEWVREGVAESIEAGDIYC